jgi:hypothetical protein
LTDLLGAKAGKDLSPLERQAAELIAKVPSPLPLAPQALARIGETLSKPAASSTGWLIGGGLGIAVVVATTALLVPRMGGQHQVPRPAIVTQQPLVPEVVRRIETSTGVATPKSAIEPVIVVTEPSLVSEPLRPATRPARKHAAIVSEKSETSVAVTEPPVSPAPALAPAEAEESALAVESRLLGLALRELRQTHDARQALVRLDEYSARFPAGLLNEEAQAARVDALLLLGRRAEALTLLEKTTFTRLPRGGELTVLRGELRAASGRCRDALPDFAASVSNGSTAEVAERGLYGQGMCRAHLGDLAGAESDLRAYLNRFPSGRFRTSAQATLRNLSTTP